MNIFLCLLFFFYFNFLFFNNKKKKNELNKNIKKYSDLPYLYLIFFHSHLFNDPINLPITITYFFLISINQSDYLYIPFPYYLFHIIF